jgi:thiopeptide-type bacteriocin biosynthesis protein
VRVGRTVLAPARWRTPESLRDNRLPWVAWQARLAEWRQLWRVPDLVRSTVDDVILDLSVPLHCQLLRDTLHHRPHVVLHETPRGGTGWCGGHAAAITVPLRGNGSPARTLPAATVAHAEVRHMPGGEWLFVKLYTQQHDDILTDRLPALLHDLAGHMDRGFFVRCVDPEPHLRIRLHRSAERLNTALWPRMHRWIEELHRSRLVSRVVVDTYEPEVNRYGGVARLAMAEEIFHADSEVVLTMLRLRRRALGRLDPDVLLAANYVDILRSTGRNDWADWFLAGSPTRTRHPVADRLIDPAGDWAELRQVDGGEQLVTAWWHRGRALERYTETFPATDRGRAQWDRAMRSILHMHHNRAHGLDPVSEARSYAVAAGTLTAHVS